VNRRMQPDDVVDAYVKWAQSSINAWTSGAARMRDVGRSDSPGYDWFAAGSAWMAEMTRTALDVYDTVCGGGFESAAPIVTPEFGVEERRVGLTGDCELTLVGPLQGQMGSDTISPDAVTFVPATLRPDDTEFHLEVWPGMVPGDAYWGKVQLVLDGKVLDPVVDVVVQVP
jgi:hypothetical protein